MKTLLREIRSCTLCKEHLPLGPRPILSAHPKSKIIIIGQAPGSKVHNSGIPWKDASGNELRSWLGVTENQFYDERNFALIPMGFCYPGKGPSGDMPPRSECAPHWHNKILPKLNEAKLILLIGHYAQGYYLKDSISENLTFTVKAYKKYLPHYFPLPHPSPRNRIWQKKNPWFKKNVVPALFKQVSKLLE